MKIKLYWVFLHGGIESIWQGRYFKRKGKAVGRDLASKRGDPWEEITVSIDGRHVTVEGGNFTGQLVGTVWTQTKELLEVEFVAD